MVTHSEESQTVGDAAVDRIFRALADATRRDIVRRTLGEEATISALAALYEMSFAAVQKHVSVLEAADLVIKRPQGRERLVRGNPDTLRAAQTLLDDFELIWRGRISRLDTLLQEDPGDSPPISIEQHRDEEGPPCPSPQSPRTPMH